MKRTLLLIPLSLLAATMTLVADEYPIKVYPCPRLDAAPTIDGTLKDACWAKAPLVSGFTLYNKPKLMDVQTSFRAAYDDQHLYLGVHCDEPNAAKLTPTAAGRDSSGCFRGETIEVFVDPRHSHSDYYQFAVNLAGSFFDGHRNDPSWNSTTKLATRAVEKGWELEMAIPWKEIGIEGPKPGMVVGLNVCRDRYAGGSREWSNWSQTMANFHDPARFGHLLLSPTEEMLGKLAAEVRKGDRRGPILVFTEAGEAGRAYLAMAREALKALDAQIAALAAGAANELSEDFRKEIADRLDVVRTQAEPFRARLRDAKTLDAAEWTRLGIKLTQLSAALRELVWDARLAALLKTI
ncbi:MAG TPA: sugar-binding protein [Planctomycetota bacterium]|nr:sugar-binding protein [Planctomycetota bacterium]